MQIEDQIKKRLFFYQTFEAGQRKKNTLENQTNSMQDKNHVVCCA